MAFNEPCDDILNAYDSFTNENVRWMLTNELLMTWVLHYVSIYVHVTTDWRLQIDIRLLFTWKWNLH